MNWKLLLDLYVFQLSELGAKIFIIIFWIWKDSEQWWLSFFKLSKVWNAKYNSISLLVATEVLDRKNFSF